MTRAGTGAGAAGGVLIVGYGNPLRGDDGAGPRAAGMAGADPRLAGATVLVRHQLTPELADEMRSARLVALLDAEEGLEPGRVEVRRVTAASGEGAASSHHVGPAALAGLARELWGAEPAVFSVSVGAAAFDEPDRLSPTVECALGPAVEALVALVEEHPRA